MAGRNSIGTHVDAVGRVAVWLNLRHGCFSNPEIGMWSHPVAKTMTSSRVTPFTPPKQPQNRSINPCNLSVYKCEMENTIVTMQLYDITKCSDASNIQKNQPIVTAR